MKRQQFKLFQTPIDLAHHYWRLLLNPGDHVIDATCGNGHDSLFLANLVFNSEKPGYLTAMDTQVQAITATKGRLQSYLPSFAAHIRFLHQCHSTFPIDVAKESMALIVYNLGYLPGSDKQQTTMSSTTLQSLEAALPLIKPGGAISITCYPGHSEGQEEEHQVLSFVSALPPDKWSSCYHQWVNRRNAPSLILLQKS